MLGIHPAGWVTVLRNACHAVGDTSNRGPSGFLESRTPTMTSLNRTSTHAPLSLALWLLLIHTVNYELLARKASIAALVSLVVHARSAICSKSICIRSVWEG